MLGGSSHALSALTNVANYRRRNKPFVVSVAPHVRSFRRFARTYGPCAGCNIDQSTGCRRALILRGTYTTALTTVQHIAYVLLLLSANFSILHTIDLRPLKRPTHTTKWVHFSLPNTPNPTHYIVLSAWSRSNTIKSVYTHG